MNTYKPTATQARALKRIRDYQDTPENFRKVLNCNHCSNFLQGTVKALLVRNLVTMSDKGQLTITEAGRQVV